MSDRWRLETALRPRNERSRQLVEPGGERLRAGQDHGGFTYLFSGGVATVTLDRIENNSVSATTGTLRLSVWATSYQPARGDGITGYRLVTFSQAFDPLAPGTYYYSIIRAGAYSPPPAGTYWIALTLEMYNPAGCPSSSSGYCVEDTFTSYTQNSFGTAAPSFTYTDIWYNPLESGWGVSITHHSTNTAFIAWYTYDEAGKSKWYFVSNCPMVGNSCSGAVYEAIGPPFGGTFDSSRVVVSPVGTMTLTFSAYGTALMSYYVKGVSAVKTIQRLSF